MPCRTALAASAALAAVLLLAAPAGAAPPAKGGGAAPGRAFALKQLARTEEELLEVRSELRRKRVELPLLKAKLKAVKPPEVSAALLDRLTAEDESVQELKQKLADWTKVIEDWKRKSTNPELSAGYRRDLVSLKAAQAELVARRKQLLPDIKEELLERARQPVQREVAAAEERVALLAALEEALEADLLAQKKKLPPAGDDKLDKQVDELAKEVRELRGAVRELTELLKRKK